MANVKFQGDRTALVIVLLAVFLILGGMGGYLIWRVNQDKTLSPTDSDAGQCPEGCYWHGAAGRCTGSGGCDWSDTYKTELICDPCDAIDPSCSSIANRGSVGPVGSSCNSSNCGGDCGKYTYKCGSVCYDASCGDRYCNYTPPSEPAPVVKYTLKYVADTGGTISGNATQTVEKGKGGTSVTAVPSTKYKFSKWSDSLTTAKRTDTNITANKTYTASFILACGDKICDPDENAQTCPSDCAANCGDGFCTPPENAQTCPKDCAANCGDGFCTHDEDSSTCPQDCPANCGDGLCTPPENARNCPKDCTGVCGDGFCTHTEDSTTCPQDCGAIPQTGLFDDSKNITIMGAVLLFLGLGWSWISSTVMSSLNTLSVRYEEGTKQYKAIQVKRNRDRFERKIVKK